MKLKPKDNKQFIVIKLQKRTLQIFLLIISGLLIGYILFLSYYLPPLSVATPAETEQQKVVIKAEGFEYRATSCYEANDTVSHEQRLQTFSKYFKINKYANRAVIRGCQDSDILIAKTKKGTWKEVNSLQLDLRQNPVWQKACLIDDITQADNVIRPENTSIDSYNLTACNYLRKYEKIMNWRE